MLEKRAVFENGEPQESDTKQVGGTVQWVGCQRYDPRDEQESRGRPGEHKALYSVWSHGCYPFFFLTSFFFSFTGICVVTWTAKKCVGNTETKTRCYLPYMVDVGRICLSREIKKEGKEFQSIFWKTSLTCLEINWNEEKITFLGLLDWAQFSYNER